eukprot:12428829-Alexandrium_andersonii.AAC.1
MPGAIEPHQAVSPAMLEAATWMFQQGLQMMCRPNWHQAGKAKEVLAALRAKALSPRPLNK